MKTPVTRRQYSEGSGPHHKPLFRNSRRLIEEFWLKHPGKKLPDPTKKGLSIEEIYQTLQKRGYNVGGGLKNFYSTLFNIAANLSSPLKRVPRDIDGNKRASGEEVFYVWPKRVTGYRKASAT